jgi:hypothetical protein
MSLQRNENLAGSMDNACDRRQRSDLLVSGLVGPGTLSLQRSTSTILHNSPNPDVYSPELETNP